jgi:hypothetical protein
VVNGIIQFVSNAPLGLLLVLFICFLSNIGIAIAFLHTIFNKNCTLVLRLCLFLFAAYIIGSTGVLGLSRYRIAIAPFCWLSLLYFITFIYSKRQHVTN